MTRRESRAPALAAALGAALLLGACSAPGAAGPAGPEQPGTSSAPLTSAPPAPSADPSTGDGAVEQLAALEERTGSRIGLFAVDTATGRSVAHRADERFAFASTSKALAAAAVLHATDDAGLDADVRVDPADVVTHSPVNEAARGGVVTLREAAEAAVTSSDNTAQNVLLEHLGGPEGLAAALRDVGDTTTEPARYETELDEVVPGDPRDTTTPRAMTTSLRAHLVDGRLEPSDRDELVSWMRASTTGLELVRAGVPAGWAVADESGTPAAYGGRNDVALVWPPGRPQDAPWVFTFSTDRPDAGPEAEPVPDLVADATAAVVGELG